ncbi:hypothetical protein [Halovulum sp. GXIMD14793]
MAEPVAAEVQVGPVGPVGTVVTVDVAEMAVAAAIAAKVAIGNASVLALHNIVQALGLMA